MDAQNSRPSISAKASLMAGVSLVLGLLFDYFFYGKIPGIGFPIYVGLILAGLFIISTYLKKRIDRQALWLLIPLIFFSAMVFVRSSVPLTLLNIVGSLLLLLLIIEASSTRLLKDFLVGDYIKIFFLPFGFIRPFLETLTNILRFREAGTGPKTFSRVVRGIIIALPVLLVFLVLFSSADLIFQKYLLNLIHIDVDFQTVLRSILVLCATSALIGAYSYAFSKKEDSAVSGATINKSHTVGHIETSILLGAVNVLFFAFILVQLTYLFGGEGNIASQGFTYAEYARKGFFELIAVAVISFLLVLVTERYTAKKDTEHTLIFKTLSTALIVQVVLIMASAFKRLLLYEEAYGFTTLRLYSHAFIVFLAAIFILLLYKIFKDKRENLFVFRAFVSILIFLAAMNILNPDAFIARRNIERFKTTDNLDIYYLNWLSDDAIPETVKILDIRDEGLRKSFARELYWRTQKDLPLLSGWQSLNISRMNAGKILGPKAADLEQYKDYQQ